MQHLKIKNFGPIKNLEMDVTDFIVMIGPQASGKSTITKNIYYFNSIKDYLLDIIQDIISQSKTGKEIKFDDIRISFLKNLRGKFVAYWGTTKHLSNFEIVFTYTSGIFIRVNVKDGYVQLTYSDQLNFAINALFKKTIDFIKTNRDDLLNSSSLSGFTKSKNMESGFIEEIGFEISSLFGYSHSSFYIPASRSLITTLPDFFINLIVRNTPAGQIKGDEPNIDPFLIDYPVKVFIDLISYMKTQFSKEIAEIVEDRKKFTNDIINFQWLKPFESLLPKILKGRYIYHQGSERLYLLKENGFVKLNFASSGQQESLWILLQLFRLTLNNISSLMVIEEPETHLYTETQIDLVSLLSHFSNINKNKMIITTHSPYILSAISNLMFASVVGKRNEKAINELIPKEFWLDPKKISAYYVDNGTIEDIIDHELNQIKVEKIDSASRILNTKYDSMLEYWNE